MLWIKIIIGWLIFSIVVSLVLGSVIKRGIEEGENEEPDYHSEKEWEDMYNK